MTHRLLSFYGDDFTGSTDALEAVASNGIPSVLFLDAPGESLLGRFAHCRAMGIAGESRSRNPAWMDTNLPGIFTAMKSFGAPLSQYKVCSTFDSSPAFGNIGRALEIGRRVFGNPWVPIAVAAPHLKRYVLFGNLFAAAIDDDIHRIDRHPSMSRHPVTPMHEADLRLHLARQTDLRIELLDILALLNDKSDTRLGQLLAHDPAAVLFDGLCDGSLRETGRLIWKSCALMPSFCLGSSGLTHALMLHWREVGIIPGGFRPPLAAPSDRIVVISGSCSPATETQIRWAMQNSYTGFRFDGAGDLTGPVLDALRQGRSAVIYTALGPADCSDARGGEQLGRALGELLLAVIRRSGVRRAMVAGGDTSTHAVRQLGIEALTFAALLSPGAPLCHAYSRDSAVNGLELVLKGGQVGPENFFEIVRKGKT